MTLNWRDEFAIVSTKHNPEAPCNGSYSFPHQVKRMGVETLTAWLAESLAGKTPRTIEYGLSYGDLPGDSPFLCDSVRTDAPYFDEETATIFTAALKNAMGALDPVTIPFHGLQDLVQCAAIFGMKEEYEQWSPVLVIKHKEYEARLQAGTTTSPSP